MIAAPILQPVPAPSNGQMPRVTDDERYEILFGRKVELPPMGYRSVYLSAELLVVLANSLPSPQAWP